MAVCFARSFLARRRQSINTIRKMNAHPSAINRISHHASGRREVTLIGVVRPVIDGSGEGVFVPEAFGTETRSEKQTPSPGTTLADPVQLAAVQVPPRNTWLELEHARQLLGPDPEQLEQLPSHDWQLDDVVSKNCDLLHVGRHRPLVNTGRLGGQEEH